MEFAQRLGSISQEIGHQPLSVYLNRRGQVIRVGVGNPFETQIPALELPRQGAERLSGIRCITVQSGSGSHQGPGQKALLAMALQRLDALVTLTVSKSGGFRRRGGAATGFIEQAHLAHLIPDPDQRWMVSQPLDLAEVVEQDLIDLVENLESEFRRQATARQVRADQDLTILVGLRDPAQTQQDTLDVLEELRRLVETAGGQVLHTLWQRREGPNSQTLIGSGKVQELALSVQDLGANMVVFDRELSPSQVRALEEQVGVRVVDRSEVILDIFAQRARTRAGKLQVELAQLNYLLPRLVGRGRTMSRLGGGIGTRGPGETQLEMERRAIQRRITKLRQEVKDLRAHRQRMRQRREQAEIPVIAIVGYTNAGKSTLLNTLTQAEVYAADQLFATLDPTTRRLEIPEGGELLLTDTVGFLTELPSQLVDAFQATLEEVTEADALLHVVDLSHPNWETQIEAVEKLLDEMPTATGPRQLIFNKIDRVDPEWVEDVRLLYPHALFISAQDRLHLEDLRQTLYRFAQGFRHPPHFQAWKISASAQQEQTHVQYGQTHPQPQDDAISRDISDLGSAGKGGSNDLTVQCPVSLKRIS